MANYRGEMIEIIDRVFLKCCFDEAFDNSVAFVLGLFLYYPPLLFISYQYIGFSLGLSLMGLGNRVGKQG
jgi:hypothetical protein